MKGHAIAWTALERRFVEARCTWPRRQLHAAFVVAFGRKNVSLGALNALCKRHGWMTGRTGTYAPGHPPANKGKPMPYHPNRAATQFKKGQLPHNTKFAGHERVSTDGYVVISVEQTNPHTGFERRYVLKHRWLWELTNGPVPKGMALKAINGKLNTDPSNWELVPRALLPRLNGKYGRGYDVAPTEIKPTILAIAKLEHAMRANANTKPQERSE